MKNISLLFIILVTSFFFTPTRPFAVDMEMLSDAGFLLFKNTDDAPDFTLNDVEDLPVSLKTYQGKVVLLCFGTTWCPSCRKEMPSLIELHNTFAEADFIVLGINVGESREIVKKYIKDKKIPFPVLYDVKGQVEKLYKVAAHPTHVLINKKGKMVGKSLGARNWMDKKNGRLIRALLANDSVK